MRVTLTAPTSNDAPPVLAYGDAITRRGITCRTTPDGIHLVVPRAANEWRQLVVPFVCSIPVVSTVYPLFSAHPGLGIPLFVLLCLGGTVACILAFRARRAVRVSVEVEVTRDEVVVSDYRDDSAMTPRRWPRHRIVKFRPNRVMPGVWVRTADREASGVLNDLDPQIVAYLCEQVTLTLPRRDDVSVQR